MPLHINRHFSRDVPFISTFYYNFLFITTISELANKIQWTLERQTVLFSNNLKLEQIREKFGLKFELEFESRTMSAALHSIVRLMPP
jgi:hypothetical protein